MRPSNPTTRQTLQIQAANPERYAVRVADAQPQGVASDGYVRFEVPPLQRGCAVYLCGLVKVADHPSEDVRAIQVLEGGQVVRRLALNQISRLPTGPAGSHILKLREGQGGPECARNFTPRAQQVISLARKEADRFHHNFVATEHLFLGLIGLGQGTAVKVLGNMGLNLESVRAEVEKQVGFGPDQKIIGHIPYMPRVKRVLALAAKEALVS